MSDTASVLHELSMCDGPAQVSPSCPLLPLITQKHLEAGLLPSVFFGWGDQGTERLRNLLEDAQL